MERYVDAVAAVVGERRLADTKARVDRFLTDDTLVADVQDLIRRRGETVPNWVRDCSNAMSSMYSRIADE
jgi:hypothetical protein